MTALAAERMRLTERWTYKTFTLVATYKAYKGAAAALIVAGADAGKVVPARTNLVLDLMVIGTFAETVDATSAAKIVNVNFDREMALEWFANSGTNAVAATDVGSMAYFEDDQTVGVSSQAYPLAGRIWAYDATKGVLVERQGFYPAKLDGLEGVSASATAFASNDSIIANNPISGTIFDIPTTGAASTVTLPATARAGTIIHFKADGTKNGHTVQYRDATGPANLTAALTASKRHLVTCVFGADSKWYANAYVSP